METERDAWLPRTPVVIAGRKYDLCGGFQQLVEAEAYVAQRIHGFNLADVLLSWGQDHDSVLNGARKLLPAALRTFHPNVSYEHAQEMFERALAEDDVSIVEALWNMWPPKTKEIQVVHENLRCDLESLAEANAFFEGKPGLVLICVEGGFTLGHVWRVWPCAVHHFRPELSMDEARQLLTIEGVRLVLGLLGIVNETASQEQRDSFAERVAMVSSEEDKREFLFRVMAKKPWPGLPQA
jgi:hypothetical protein